MASWAIALGSNLGNSLTALESYLTVLDKTPGVKLKAISSWYQTKPVANPELNQTILMVVLY